MSIARPVPTNRLKVVIRHLVVRDDADLGPAQGEYDVTLGICAGPTRTVESGAARASIRWQRPVWSGYTYDVRAELGPIAIAADGWICIAGAGVEHDAFLDDQVRGGLAMLGRERRFGLDHWWRTTNGRHFDLIFSVIPADATAAACPPWTGDVLDAPCPEGPTEAEYRAILPPGFDRRGPGPGGAVTVPHVPPRALKHTYVPAYALM